MFTFEYTEIGEFIQTEIPTYQRDLLNKSLSSNSMSLEFYEEIGKELTGESTSERLLLNTGKKINSSSFYDKLKIEVYKLICTQSREYKSERDFVGKNFKELVTIISTAIAATFSLGTGVIIGIITNILISVVKVNLNAWCELQKDTLK